MITLLHCADLHLSGRSEDETQYSLSVLDEIISLAGKHRACALLFCGDTFDSFNDAVRMKDEFRKRMDSLPKNCEVFLIAGNHEDIGRGNTWLSAHDFGIAPDHIVEGDTFKYFAGEGFDLLAIPHRQEYRDYAEWPVPEKGPKKRIAMAHGIVTGMVFSGIDDIEDSSASAMDVDLFLRHGVDYAAMGHIHAARSRKIDLLDIVYPGSARVWRRNEFGPRCVSLVHCNDVLTYELQTLESAGQFRSYGLFVDFEGNIEPLRDSSEGWSPNDRVLLSFSGIVEDEVTARGNIMRFVEEVQKFVRLVEREEQIEVVSGIASQSLAKKFLERWLEKKPEEPEKKEAWKRAREIGLMKIRDIIEARR